MKCAVVVGAGLAGLTAALRLAEDGVAVTVVTRGVGGLYLSSGAIDVLGYAPHRVDHPLTGVDELVSRNPGHPYSRVGPEAVRRALAWFRGVVGERYMGDPDRNLLLPTALGVARPTMFAPVAMARADLHAAPRMAVVGFRAMKDLHPTLVSGNLSRAPLPAGAVTARAVWLHANPWPGHADVGPMRIARALDDPAFRQRVASELGPHLEPGEVVAFPALVGVRRHEEAHRDMERLLEHEVAEIPSLPPCLPGIRLDEFLKREIRARDGKIVLGPEVVAVDTAGGEVTGVFVAASGHHVRHPADAVVLATGGVDSGGIEIDSRGSVREAVLNLPLSNRPPEGTPPFSPDHTATHPALVAGVNVDHRMRPVHPDGDPVYSNLFAAGGLLGGAEPWREKSGEGICLATATAAAEAVLEELA